MIYKKLYNKILIFPVNFKIINITFSKTKTYHYKIMR